MTPAGSPCFSRRAALAGLLVPLAGLSLAACDEEEELTTLGTTVAGKLEIVSSDWNGWDPSYTPTPATSTLDLRPGASIQLSGLGEKITFTIDRIEGVTVHLKTSEALSSRTEQGGYDYRETRKDFTIRPGEVLELATPSLDAGRYYALRIIAE